MKICPRCGKQLRNEVKFCPACGENLVRAEITAREDLKLQKKTDTHSSEVKDDWKQVPERQKRLNEFLDSTSFGVIKIVILLVVLVIAGTGILHYKRSEIPDQAETTSAAEAGEQTLYTVPEEKQQVRVFGSENRKWISGLLVAGEELDVSSAAATSTIQQKDVINDAMLMFDKDDSTNWQEGVNGYGEGESVTVWFKNSCEVRIIGFKNGNWKNDRYYYGNAMPAVLKLRFTDEEITVPFQNKREIQWVVLSRPVITDKMTVEIVKVYPGTTWEDTVITEIMPYAYQGNIVFPEDNGQWIKEENGYWYSNQNGSYTINNWQLIDGKWYFFNEDGYMKTGWINHESNWYYLGEDGGLLTSQTTPDGYYVDANGVRR